ncbi:arylsulfatase [Bordetella petrii]|uniref:arylsulfatase n=1 Tax=Bordetella petrii TaxID=94624 RepID=UPI001E588AA6|nr:arylsulfatase [Bordetella petrii]MCD0502537.1 arylsulfatase [Bordetella petrii]
MSHVKRPNIVFVVLDDVGFSDLGCYGSEIPTPRIDQLATEGLRYNNFHVTAMCSPTRACLLTGRNAHSVGVGIIAEWANGQPGYDGRIYPSAGTLPEVLRREGYNTMAVGKWHLAGTEEYGAAGPFSNWPLGKGFNRWYGFHGALADQYYPELYVDNHPIHLDPPENYHLSVDLVDQSLGMIRDHCTSAPAAPFMMYVAFGACHWPHQAPREYIDRFKGKYDQGWDDVRVQRLKAQIEMGIVPAGTRLAPRNDDVRPWDEVRRDDAVVSLSTRLQEAYAGFMVHTDEQIGRLVDGLQALDVLDDTIVVLLSDNGASPEGGPTGAINLRKHMVYELDDPGQAVRHLDKIGGAEAFNHYPTGWAQVSNTPLKWYKKDTHGGGVRAPLILRWPKGFTARGEIRTQFHHVIDIAPTLYDVLGITPPDELAGVAQQPLHGISMAYSFDQAGAASRRARQYFELLGDRALWQDGWKAVTRHRKGTPMDTDVWELYHITQDFSEASDLAQTEPARLQAMVQAWLQEAERYGVLPLDDREWERAAERIREGSRAQYVYRPHMARIDRLMAPDVTGKSFRIEASLNRSGAPVQGVMLAWGSRLGGLVLYARAGKLVLEYVYSQDERVVIEVDDALPTGKASVVASFDRNEDGSIDLSLEGTGLARARGRSAKSWPTHGMTAGLSCGHDAGHPVSNTYTAPFPFAGSELVQVTLTVDQAGGRRQERPASAFQED